MRMRYTAKERSRDLGWLHAQAVVNGQDFFRGVFKSRRKFAKRDGWFCPKEYVRGWLDVITDYGRCPRKGGAQ